MNLLEIETQVLEGKLKLVKHHLGTKHFTRNKFLGDKMVSTEHSYERYLYMAQDSENTGYKLTKEDFNRLKELSDKLINSRQKAVNK